MPQVLKQGPGRVLTQVGYDVVTVVGIGAVDVFLFVACCQGQKGCQHQQGEMS